MTVKTSPRYRLQHVARELDQAKGQIIFALHNLRAVRDHDNCPDRAEVRYMMQQAERVKRTITELKQSIADLISPQ